MQEKVLESLVNGFTKALIQELKGLFDEGYDKLYDEAKQFIGKGLKKYLNNQQEKYSKVKTLLRGNTPTYLYDIYYPLKLTKKNKDGNIEIILTDSIKKLFCHSNYLTIIGDAGSGKSTLSKHLFLNCIKENLGIPLLVELRYLNEREGKLEEYIIETINQYNISVNHDILDRLMVKGKFVFFLDGYDELDSITKKKVSKKLMEFVNKYHENKFVLTTRPYSNIEHLPLFLNLKMKDLDLKNSEIQGFVYKQLPNEKEVAKKIEQSITSNKSKYIMSFLKNPLLLSLYILTFQSNASIPDKKHIFYGRVINALFSEHDSKSKLGFVREKTCDLSQEEFELILKIFSYLSYFENKFNFDKVYIFEKLKLIKSKYLHLKINNNHFIEDLKSAVAIWTDDDGEFAFAHRSLQEYFACRFIKELSPDENKRVYEKIIDKYIDSRGPIREIENLLSLLEEMDTLNYRKHFELPILEHLNSIIYPKNLDKTRDSYILFLCDGIGFRYHPNKIIELLELNEKERKGVYYDDMVNLFIRRDVYKNLILHQDYTRELYSSIQHTILFNLKYFISNKVELTANFNKIKNQLEHPMKLELAILFNGEITPYLSKLFNNSKINEVTEAYIEYIQNRLHFTKNYINSTSDIDKDLVDMI